MTEIWFRESARMWRHGARTSRNAAHADTGTPGTGCRASREGWVVRIRLTASCKQHAESGL